jgi:formate hydrogenlyase subunit 6/NADH:ubiquinone oxidoreductase subunit I
MENDNMDACPTDSMVQDENFQNNLYRNESDLFDRKSLQLNYYQEEKVYPGDINKMLKYYDSNKKCKYVNINCDVPSFFIN